MIRQSGKSRWVLSSFLILASWLVSAVNIQTAWAEEQLQITDLVAGSGDEAVANSEVSVHYTGWLLDGTKFDSSLDRDDPFVFMLGARQVIAGWDQGILGMKVGGKRELIIPASLAYGSRGAGGVIPPDATLKFEVSLLSVSPPPYQNISTEDLKRLMSEGVKIVDLRRQDEWDATGVIEGSLKITAFDGSGRFLQSFPVEFQSLIQSDEPVVLVCRSGNRSLRIANAITSQAGYTKVYNLVGGIMGWIDKGNPVRKD